MLNKIFCLISLVLILKPSLISSRDYNKNEIHRHINVKGNIVSKTPGRPFPKPQSQVITDIQQILDEKEFSFQYDTGSNECDLLSVAFDRYYRIIFRPQEYDISGTGKSNVKKIHHPNKNEKKANENAKEIKRALVYVKLPCEEYPTLESDESYALTIAGDIVSIRSKSVWGSLRGLETFSQLVIENNDGSFAINETEIVDFPRFNHRGAMLDTSRHYIDPSILKIHLDAMAANKMNVFHWHIVDDQSFPYVSETFPNLSKLGAFDQYNHIYTSEDIKDLIEYARLRGIRVIPEFDSPGHTLSWGKAVPILTPCYTNSEPNGDFGPIDPSNNLTYTFWKTFIKELSQKFPDKYIHLGGDEVDFGCWQSNPDVNKFMQDMQFGKDYSKLEQYYMQSLLDIVNQGSPGTGYIIWQEVIDNFVKVKPDTVVEVWKEGWPEEMAKVTQLGYRALLSTCWYLNYISYGSDWVNYYKCEPFDFSGTEEQKKLVIGGEACQWGEYVDGSNVISRTWPRASAVAERLWSNQNVTDINDASDRIEEHRCRMIRRGIKPEPFTGPGFCDYEVTA
jgi:hexosaminidase